MAPTFLIPLALAFLLSLSINPTVPSSLINELSQPPPPNFPAIVSNNCLKDPSLRYCNSAATDITNIYKSTVVARHLCAASNNSDCNLSFSKIDLRSRPKVAPLYLSFAFFWKYCPLSVLSIDLSNNSLVGPFPSDVLQCTQIHSLDISLNKLDGTIPLENFTLLSNLSFLNLSYNHFKEGNVDGIAFFKRFNSSSFLHSGLLPSDHHYGFKVTTAILLLTGVLVSVVSAVGCFGWVFVRQPDLLPSFLWRSHKFTLAILKKATDGFSEDNLVLRGERGEIYKGKLRDGLEVEIKVQRGRISVESHRVFDEECRVLVQLRHKNLVKVLGWCDRRELRAVVMERMWVCSVEGWLLGTPPWKHRLNVSMGLVEAMCYLQEQRPSIGYDLRTRNVMLTKDNEPLILKLKFGDQNTESRNIYKFGLFLLELVTNKRPHEAFERGEMGLIDWVSMHYPGHEKKVIDEKMKLTSTTYKQIKQTIDIGLACTDLPASHLPTISHIYSTLHKSCTSSLVQTAKSHKRPQK